ncbi:MAG TPA: hypothetical protein VF911_19605 [Thermoanaerobaculia bacterium]|jgi:hypothetical protein
MDLIITLIGIITLSCGEPTTANPRPCEMGFPKKIEVLIPDGRYNEKVCKAGNDADPDIEPHEAFIRVRGALATASPSWPTPIDCDDGTPCVLYPIQKRSISIDGLSSGPGVTKIENLVLSPRWSQLMPGLKLKSRNAIGRMTIDAGVITFRRIMQGAVSAEIRVPNVTGERVIRATSTTNVLTLRVPESAQIDIINLPRSIALSDLTSAHNHNADDCDHFFLHYLLTDNPPAKNCGHPDPHANDCRPSKKPRDPHAGLRVACSNTTYP